MKVTYLNEHCVDCTSDPHDVSYPELETALIDVLEVCKHKVLHGVNSITLREVKTHEVQGWAKRMYQEPVEWRSDTFTEIHLRGEKKQPKQMTGPEAAKHKIEGLFFYDDAPDERKLPPGLTGIEHAIKMWLKEPERFRRLSIGVMFGLAAVYFGK